MSHKMYFENWKFVKMEWVEDEITSNDIIEAKELLTKIANDNQLYYGYDCENRFDYDLFVKDYKGNRWGYSITIDRLGVEGEMQILRETAKIMKKVLKNERGIVYSDL
jgi:hypothetical protein